MLRLIKIAKRLGNKIYDWFLWIIGFREDEDDDDTISDMLWRSKERLGWRWWVLSIGSIIISFIILGFQIWLLFHTIYLKAKAKIKRGRAPLKKGKRNG
ncbi:hypothetical protein ES708_26991 [subsurface metagenome]